jgi:SM-20-related protein
MLLDHLPRLGFFVRRNFWDAETCARLVAAARGAPAAPAMVGPAAPVVDEGARRSLTVDLPEAIRRDLHGRVTALGPELSRYFAIPLAGCRAPDLLRYPAGGFFHAHRDQVSGPDVREDIRARQVSVVVFLNARSDAPREGAYGGGAFVIYAAMPTGAPGTPLALPLTGEPGLLIAFRSREVVHAVAPVTHGERYSVVTWFS